MYLSSVSAHRWLKILCPLAVAVAFAGAADITLDGDLSDWTSADLLVKPWEDLPARIYGFHDNQTDPAAQTYYIALEANEEALSIGPHTTIWLNTDQQTQADCGKNLPTSCTGFPIFTWAVGAEYNINVNATGVPRLYTGESGSTFIDDLDYAFSDDRKIVEIKLPAAKINNTINNINVVLDINFKNDWPSDPIESGIFMPDEYWKPQYEIKPRESLPPRTVSASSKRVAVIYSNETRANFYNEMHYSQLYASTQHQVMMAGIPYDLLYLSDLRNLENIVNYDALIFPLCTHVSRADYEKIHNNLIHAVYSYKIGIITSRDFLTKDETDGLLNYWPVNTYDSMEKLMGITSVDSISYANATVKASSNIHPAMNGYVNGETILEYDGSDYFAASYGPFSGVNSIVDVIATQDVISNNNNITMSWSNQPAVIASTTDARNVHFSTEHVLADGNMLWQAIQWVVYGDTTPVALKMGRHKSMFVSRNDMDKAYYFATLNRTEIPLLHNFLRPWKDDYNFVGTYFIDIGDNIAEGKHTNWDVSGPLYQEYLDLGNEMGSHSITHPYNVSDLSDAEMEYEFNQARNYLVGNLSLPDIGTAIPGASENFDGATRLARIMNNYISGGYSGKGAGYPSAFGKLFPDFVGIYFAPNMFFDFSLIEWLGWTSEEAEAFWVEQYQSLLNHASQPIVHFPWHDYAVTCSVGGEFDYTVEMIENTIAMAYNDNTEFVTSWDAHTRIKSFASSGMEVTETESTITAMIDASSADNALGKFSLCIHPSDQVIYEVEGWYAYDETCVFLPHNGGAFVIHKSDSANQNVTRIVALPMRAELISAVGDGTELTFTFLGEGNVTIHLNGMDAESLSVTGTDDVVVSPQGAEVTMTWQDIGEHTGVIQLATAETASTTTTTTTTTPPPPTTTTTASTQAPPTTDAPTKAPTDAPTKAPTDVPTDVPTKAPTDSPTKAPTDVPTKAPTDAPTESPTDAPTDAPTKAPTRAPTDAPTRKPTQPVSTSCQDSNSKTFPNWRGQLRSCSWLRQSSRRINTYCYDNRFKDATSEACPETCMACSSQGPESPTKTTTTTTTPPPKTTTTTTMTTTTPQPETTTTTAMTEAPLGSSSCDLGLEASCIQLTNERCVDKPRSMTLQFNGGSSCTDSVHNQDSGKVDCYEENSFDGGNVEIWAKKGDKVYFMGHVTDGDQFTLIHPDSDQTTPDTDFDSEITIEAYSGNYYQEVTFHTKCDAQELKLMDKFGSFQVISITEEEQGTITWYPSCDEIYKKETPCTQKPKELVLRVDGGRTCDDSSFAQEETKVTCQDASHVSSNGGDEVIITVYGGGTKFFSSQVVGIGEDIVVGPTSGSTINSKTLVEITNTAGHMLQSVEFESTCSQPLKLGDMFGSLTVVSFTNDEQMHVSSFVPVQLTYTITNSRTSPISVQEMEVEINGEVHDLTVDGTIPSQGKQIISEMESIDSTLDRTYQITPTLSVEGCQIDVSDELEFTVGRPDVVDDHPSTMPTFLPVEGTTCDMDISCKRLSKDLCIDTAKKLVLRFDGYRSSEGSSNAQDAFEEETLFRFNGGSEKKYIKAYSDDDVYFEGDVAIGDEITLVHPDGSTKDLAEEMNIEIQEGGFDVQFIIFDASCKEPLRLMDTFAGFEVVSFTNKEQGTIKQNPSCATIYDIPTDECTDDPLSLELRIDGGRTCTQSNYHMNDDKVECHHYDTVPSKVGDMIHVIVFDGSTPYLSQVIAVGETFTVSPLAGKTKLESDMTVRIKDMDGNHLQEVTFKSSCSEALWSGDTFGAVRVISFTNSKQGYVSKYAHLQFSYTLTNKGPGGMNVLGFDISRDGTEYNLPSPISAVSRGTDTVVYEVVSLDTHKAQASTYWYKTIAKVDTKVCDARDSFSSKVVDYDDD